MVRQYSEPQLGEKREAIAPVYDRMDAIVERLGVAHVAGDVRPDRSGRSAVSQPSCSRGASSPLACA